MLFSLFSAMLMMQPMIWMEKICKEAVSALSSPANLVTAEGAAEAVEDLEEAEMTAGAAEDLAAVGADQGETHLDQELTTD